MNRPKIRRKSSAASGWTPFEKAYLPALPEAMQAQTRMQASLDVPWGCWRNNRYQVTLYRMHPGTDKFRMALVLRGPEDIGVTVTKDGELVPVPCAQLSIKRIDRRVVTQWRDLQRIKDEIAGTDCEAVQLFPSSSRLVDQANQYHLWVMPPKLAFPVGMFGGKLLDTDPRVQEAVAPLQDQIGKGPPF